MTNVTLSIKEEDLKQARLLALQQGTSLNSVVREFIADYIGRNKRYEELTARILRRAEQSQYRSGKQKRSRDQLHER